MLNLLRIPGADGKDSANYIKLLRGEWELLNPGSTTGIAYHPVSARASRRGPAFTCSRAEVIEW